MAESQQRARRKSHERACHYDVILDAKAITLGTNELVYTTIDRPNRPRCFLLLLFVVSLTVFIAGLAALMGLWNAHALNGALGGRIVRQVNSIDSGLKLASDSYQSALRQAAQRRDPVALFDAASGYQANLKGLISQANALAKGLPEGQPTAHALEILRDRIHVVQSANLLMLDAAYSAEFRASAFDAVNKAQTYASKQDIREHELLLSAH